LLVESLGLALLGGVIGIGLGAGLLRGLGAAGLKELPRAGEVHIDGTVVVVCLGLSVAAGLFVGLFPVAGISRIKVNDALHEDSRTGTTGKKTRSVRRLLVAAQIGFAFALLVGAALFLTSFRRLLHVDPGFHPEGVVTASVNLPKANYGNDEACRRFVERALPVVRAVPGVTRAGVTNVLPLSTDHSDSVILAEGYQMRPGESIVSPLSLAVTPSYFEAMGISMVRGRSFDERDSESVQGVVIVDERLAQHFWPNGDPVGRRMYLPRDPKNLLKVDEHTKWFTVVGVSRTLRYENLNDSGAAVGAYYFPLAQNPDNYFTFVLKTAGDGDAAVRALRTEIARLDPDLAVFNVHSMAERIDVSLASRRTTMLVANAFGVAALLLAMMGIYGVLAYLVTQRTREMGIRVALGSTRGGILRLVLKEGFALVGAGLLLGLIGAALLQGVVAKEIYGVKPLDPLVLGSVMLVLGMVALAACALPAWRAMGVDPIVALRSE
jgi:predicted permease